MSALAWLGNKLFPIDTLPERTMVRVRFEARRFRPIPKIGFAIAGFER
jgi:hypothetical protein